MSAGQNVRVSMCESVANKCIFTVNNFGTGLKQGMGMPKPFAIKAIRAISSFPYAENVI
jgi:hypothetical protein